MLSNYIIIISTYYTCVSIFGLRIIVVHKLSLRVIAVGNPLSSYGIAPDSVYDRDLVEYFDQQTSRYSAYWKFEGDCNVRINGSPSGGLKGAEICKQLLLEIEKKITLGICKY